MLDDDTNTPTTESTPAVRTRRRAAGRPAGPPAAVSTDIFAAPASDAPAAPTIPPAEKAPTATVVTKTPARRSTRKAAPPAPVADDAAAQAPADDVATAGDTTADAAAAPAAKPARKRPPRKKAASKPAADPAVEDAPTGSTADETVAEEPVTDEAGASEEQPAKAPAKRPARKRAPRAARPADEVSPVAVAFQAPEPVAAPAAQVEDDDEDDEQTSTDDATTAEATTAPEQDQDESGEGGGGGSKRRRRSRGGRRRNKSDEPRESQGQDGTAAESQTDDAEGDQAAADSDDQEGEGQGGTTRRRRRRARAGDKPSASPDDPENTVVRVREGRNPEDEIAGVSGSTRLEAKKQRRREGREAGRRRAPIVSEAEFLARREAVDRQMVVRQHRATSHGSTDNYTQIAVLEDSVLVEHYVARESQTSLIGNVYLGKVQNVLPSMEAAFVDIGAGRNAVIYAGEVDWSGVQNGKARKIEEALSPGQQILVQVTKDPIGQKGARLTSQISLPGRFLVYVPGGQSNGISRKLPDTERSRLKALLKEVLPEDAGVIVRTAAEGATEDQLTRDVTALTARWEDIKVKAGLDDDASPKAKAPQLLYAEPDLVIKVVRDLFNEDFASLVVEGSDAWDNISGYIRHVAPDLAERLQEWSPADHDGRDSFDVLRIDEQIQKALQRKVWLPSGGSLVIDRTEAMTVVDVNTGKFTGSGGNLEETVTKNNLEAAEEIVRQLRLRDIGGIIVVDFIDMVLESNRDLVLRRLVECLGRDRTRHQVAEVTSLGLVQMTRKRIGTGLLEAFSETCTHCQGRGLVVHDHPVEPKGGGNDDDRGGRGRRSRGGKGKGGGDQSNQGGQSGNQGGNQAGNQGGAPSPKDVAAMARADKAAEAAQDEASDAPAEESTSTPAAPEKAAEKAPEKPQVQQRQRKRSSQPKAPAVETTATTEPAQETAPEPVPQPVAEEPTPTAEQPAEQPVEEPAGKEAGKEADKPAGSQGVVTRTRRAARRTTPLTTGEAAAVVVDPTTQPSAPEPAAPAPTEAPKVVTRTRSSRSTRSASQGSVPTMEQADAPSGVGEPPVSGTGVGHAQMHRIFTPQCHR
ncbi:Rne/Rng family ribonuclease [Aeromicrobium sp. REDSEA-S38_B2]|uniref:Rne/Rng family ribonuclease n=1 Tax=Aeromicrobium sp. REDSEA-S38_B2 TaxID=1811528 RepID=UPI000A7658EA|nr:Rne/Rng family ribonuclease [Aeromicrobium sp. REDSEA-S38_B2]